MSIATDEQYDWAAFRAGANQAVLAKRLTCTAIRLRVVALQPSKTIKLIGLPLVFLAMFSVAGGHWAVLQTVAWSQMLWDYSREAGSFVVGIQRTFSGEYPCSLCRSIEQGKEKEEKLPASVKTEKKVEVFLVAFKGLIQSSPAKGIVIPVPEKVFWTRFNAPPAPVPIGVV